MKKMKQTIKMIKEFEYMRNMAELKAYSKLSIERPLNDSEHDKMMELKKEVFGL